MRAMILAAGKGARLRPITETCPKPLVKVKNKALIVYHIENLKKSGIIDIVINVFHLGECIQQALGTGDEWGVKITYSFEPTLLEVGGGICYALPLLGEEPFILVNGDIWTDYSFQHLPTKPKGLGHLILVDNPSHHPKGDFLLLNDGQLAKSEEQKQYTYAGIAVLWPAFFQGYTRGEAFRLAPLFEQAIREKTLFGEYYHGQWTDVGTLERLQSLENELIKN